MANFFRDQPMLRYVIGAAFLAFMWALYLVRIVFGIGPMHDAAGNQSPATHYLAGALVVTAMVAVWFAIGRRMGRKD